MKIYIPILLILSAGLITGCQSDGELSTGQPEEVQLLVTMSQKQTGTRVNVNGNLFENGDEFQFFFNSDKPVSAGTDLKTASYTYNATLKEWTPSPPIYWDDHKIKERSFCAFLPYDDSNADKENYTFNVEADQSLSDASNYKISDLLMARTLTEERLVPLQFHHVLSRVIVNVTAPTDATKPDEYFNPVDFAITDVSLKNVRAVAQVEYETLIETQASSADFPPAVTTTASGVPGDIKMLCTATAENKNNQIKASYVGIVPPQTIEADKTSVTFSITVDGVDKKYYFNYDDVVNYQQGKNTTFNITLRKNKVVLSTEDGEVTITAWELIEAKDDDPIKL